MGLIQQRRTYFLKRERFKNRRREINPRALLGSKLQPPLCCHVFKRRNRPDMWTR